MNKLFPKIAFACMVSLIAISSCKSKKKATKNATPIVLQKPQPKPGALKAFSELIRSNAKRDSGLFNVYSLDDKFYYEIPDSLLGREMLSVTRYAKTPPKDGTYGGEEVNSQVWIWEKIGKKILIKVPSYPNVAGKDSEMYESVRNSNLAPILASFDIMAYGKDSSSWVIELNDFIPKDIAPIGLPQAERLSYKVQRIDVSR